jgi:hypothetical protein
MAIDDVEVAVVVGVSVDSGLDSEVSLAGGNADAANVAMASSVCVTDRFTSEVGVASAGNPQAENNNGTSRSGTRIDSFGILNSLIKGSYYI